MQWEVNFNNVHFSTCRETNSMFLISQPQITKLTYQAEEFSKIDKSLKIMRNYKTRDRVYCHGSLIQMIRNLLKVLRNSLKSVEKVHNLKKHQVYLKFKINQLFSDQKEGKAAEKKESTKDEKKPNEEEQLTEEEEAAEDDKKGHDQK